MNDDTNEIPNRNIKLGSDKLQTFFIEHLNRIYSAKIHLVEKLPTLQDEAYFSDLRHAIAETVESVEKQIARMQLIYEILDENVAPARVKGLSGLVDDAFNAIQQQKGESELRDLSIIFYMQNIESVEIASFQILRMAAVKIKNTQVSKLLKENYEASKAVRTLFLLISTKYIVN